MATVSNSEGQFARASEAGTRNAGIDHIRIILTALVILHHTAIVYGGSGGWFWRAEPDASSMLLVMFNAINQSYFMGFFFLLAGYYTPAAYERKGPARFLQDRLVRLGLPLIVFFFLLHPLTVAIARTTEGHPILPGWWQLIMARDFGPGPLWFAEALLIFAALYAAWCGLRRRQGTPVDRPHIFPSSRFLALSAIVLGITSFAIRLAVPVGEEIFWLQLGYFPPYIFLFAIGCAAARTKLLDHVSLKVAKPWMLVSIVAGLLLPVVMLTRGGAGGFEGGWSFNALFYALWDPLFAWGMILGLLWTAQRWWSQETRLSKWLTRGAFGAYIVHPPILVAISIEAAAWGGPPLAKFAIVGLAACAGSFAVSAALRVIPGVRKVI